MERIKILNTYIDNLSMDETVEEVDRYLRDGKPLHLMGVNADKINALNENERLKRIVNGCEIINADGTSAVWASRVLKRGLKERVAGVDLMQQLLALAERKGYSVYFLGAKQKVIEDTVNVIRKRYPNVKVAGFRNGYFSENEWGEIAQELKDCKAQLVFVGITSPLKEYLVEFLQKEGVTAVLMGVGGSFDVISGNIPRAPLWMQNAGLEWLFRVMQEPGRLWKRYLIGNIRFIIRVYREKYSESELNVLHISRTMGQGGAERIVYQLADSLRDRCNVICVASTGGCHVEQLEAEGIRHFQIDDLEQKNPLVIIRTLLRLFRIVRRYKINIIHSHHRMAAVYGRALKLFYPRLKLVYTAHNVFYDKKRLTRAALRHTAVVAVGFGVRDNLTDFYGISPACISVIHNAVHPEPSSEEYMNQTLSEWKARGLELVGIIGRLSEQKGVDVFLRVIADLKNRGRQVRGIIIGDGEDRDRLVRMTQKLRIEEEILFLGYQEHVSTLISQLDLVVMPSRWEGFPLLVLEAFAEKKAIVGSNISGINEIITDGENGRLVAKDKPDLFADAVCELMEHPEIRNKIGENGFEYYKKSFSYEVFAEQYFQLYQTVLEMRKR